MQDLRRLCECGTTVPHVYIYNPNTLSSERPPVGSIPWPMEYILTKFSRKHIFSFTHSARPLHFAKFLEQWRLKVLWKQFFASVDQQENPHWKIRMWRETPAYPHHAPAQLVKGLAGVSESVFNYLMLAQHKLSTRREFFTPFLIKLGFRMVREKGWSVFPSDKDGGYVLVPADSVSSIYRKVLEKSDYTRVYFTESDASALLEEYTSHCKCIGSKLEDFQLTRALLPTSGHKPIAFLDCTIKTHKPAGLVVPRAIHTSVMHSFTAGMRWIASILKPIVYKNDHVLKNSVHLLRQLEGLEVEPTDRLIKIDIADFFMSGNHRELASLATREVSPVLQQHVQDLLFFILDHQFVAQKGDPERVFKVMKGSGMGLICSGEVSDLAFLELVEKSFVLKPHVQRKFGVKHYSRFKDDIFLVMKGDMTLCRRFFRLMQARSKYFVLKCESVSQSEVVMLDVLLKKSAGLLQASPYSKPSSNWLPLSHESMHPPHVHTSWPRAFEARLRSLSSTKETAKSAVHGFRIALAKTCNNHTYLSGLPSTFKHRAPRNPDISYLVLPYFYGCNARELREVIGSVTSKLPPGTLPEIRIAWCLSGNHAIRHLRAIKN